MSARKQAKLFEEALSLERAKARERAAADAKLKRVVQRLRETMSNRDDGYMDGWDDALDAVARAWEADHG